MRLVYSYKEADGVATYQSKHFTLYTFANFTLYFTWLVTKNTYLSIYLVSFSIKQTFQNERNIFETVTNKWLLVMHNECVSSF